MLKTDFIDGSAGKLLLSVMASSGSRSAVVVLPPFAEELNKTRHLLSKLMRQLSAQGHDSFLLDNYGTGDSEGDLDNTTVDIWRNDLQLLLQLLAQQGYQQLSFVAVRFGTLQLFDLLNRHQLPLPVKHLVLWQPLFDTAKFWQQFVRIKLAERIDSHNKPSQAELEQQLKAGNTIEIAGYPLNLPFFTSLMQMQCQCPPQLQGKTIHWQETSALTQPGTLTQQNLARLNTMARVNLTLLRADAYWQSSELAPAEQLLTNTVHAIVSGKHYD